MAENPEYGTLARVYDLFDLIFLLGGKGNPRAGLCEIGGEEPRRILDVCAGTAGSALRVAARYPQSKIVGIDLSQAMLDVANKKIARRKLRNIEVRRMSAEALTFADDTFDAVMISFALHELGAELRERVIREMARVLKPGGLFLVVDFARQRGWWNRLLIALWSQLEPDGFRDFLALDWRVGMKQYGLEYQGEREYSLSNLYVLRKDTPQPADTAI